MHAPRYGTYYNERPQTETTHTIGHTARTSTLAAHTLSTREIHNITLPSDKNTFLPPHHDTCIRTPTPFGTKWRVGMYLVCSTRALPCLPYLPTYMNKYRTLPSYFPQVHAHTPTPPRNMTSIGPASTTLHPLTYTILSKHPSTSRTTIAFLYHVTLPMIGKSLSTR
jgi:hypothetical protein